jgi:hypothetical protein
VPGIVGALVCSLLTVPLSSDVSRRGAALTMGALSAGTGAIAFSWLAMALTAAGSGTPFLIVLAPVAWGTVVFGVALLTKADTPRSGSVTGTIHDSDPPVGHRAD